VSCPYSVVCFLLAVIKKLDLIIQFNSIQFNSYLFTCQLNSSKANYKVSMNMIKRHNVNRQGQNVAAKKQLKFKYISIWNNNNNSDNNNNNNNNNNRSRYSSWLRAGRPRGRSSSPGRFKNFLFSTSSRSALGPTQPPIQWVPRALFPGIKRLGREADHSPPASAEVKKMWIYTSTPPYASWRSA
jgi:hypothetical protein